MKLQKHCRLLFILPFLVLSLIPIQSAVAQHGKAWRIREKGAYNL